MRRKQNFLILFLCLCVLFACKDSNKKNKATSISGEIFNPKNPFIVLLKDNQTLDTVMLDEKNHFHYQFDEDFEDGLYTFLHDYNTHFETQMFYLEKGDSLQLRLNTQEFDQSLMYSGEGAIANNFLMLVFLENIKNGRLLLEYYRISPEDFLTKADSIKSDYVNDLGKLYNRGLVSSGFKKLANEVIDYSYFDMKERYYFLVNKYRYEIKRELSDDFLDHRQIADFNHQSLQNYYIYQHFLDDYLKNKSVEKCQESGGEDCFNFHSKDNLQMRLAMVDSLFELESLRERFLRNLSGWIIVNSQTEEEIDETLQFLEKANFDNQEFEKIKNLARVHKRQFIGNISGLALTSGKGEKISIASLISKPTVFYYWSLHFKSHHEKQHQKIRQYQRRYPEVNFVGINIDYSEEEENFDQWQTGVQNFGYDDLFEFQLVCPSNQRIFYRNYLNKAVFVDTTGNVLDGNLNLQEQDFEGRLLALLNVNRNKLHQFKP